MNPDANRSPSCRSNHPYNNISLRYVPIRYASDRRRSCSTSSFRPSAIRPHGSGKKEAAPWHRSGRQAQAVLQFHTRICELSGCDDTVEILQGLWNKCDSFKSIYYSLEGRINYTLSEHAKIIQGLKNRDIDATKQAIYGHLKDVVECVGRQDNFS